VAIPEHALALQMTVAVMPHLKEQIIQVEHAVHARVKLRPAFQALLTGPGIGQTLALTIMLETGEIGRVPTVGQFASSCRCVGSPKLSHGKRKGQGHTKNGNKYLAGAFVEAAHFALRDEPQIAQFYPRKRAKTKVVVALKAVPQKLARASYSLMRDTVPFEVTRAFA
jgi:transposase